MAFFETIHKDKNTHARAGVIHTDHGDIQTPVFMPVGTNATVKTLDSSDLFGLDAKTILANNYHLHLRPGEDLIASVGGIHKFMNWERPVLTDSGGFQVFSLGLQKDKKAGEQAKLVSIDEDGATFRSHIDGSSHRFTPESATECQHKIGADIIMAFDECTPDNIQKEYTEQAMKRTHRWAERCLDYHKSKQPLYGHRQFLFGIIQGANYKDLREESAKKICGMGFDGIAVGGESVGYNMSATREILDWVAPFVPEEKPLYTMGVGLAPSDLLAVVEGGADMFDCVAPARLARHGMLYVRKSVEQNERINIKNAVFEKDTAPIDEKCGCEVCKKYSRAYLHHLFDANEITGMRLATIHNLFFMLDLMRRAREAILRDEFSEFLRDN